MLKGPWLKKELLNKMKKILFPQEFDTWYVLPAIRKKLALKLLEMGMTQKAVAETLQTSAATITHYKKDKRVKEDVLGAEVDPLITEAAGRIKKDSHLLVPEVVRINAAVKEKGLFCKMYQDKVVHEATPCNSCVKCEENYCY